MVSRKIGGKRYTLYDAYRNKRFARQVAKDSRKRGVSVRIIENTSIPRGGLRWEFWVATSDIRKL